MTTVDSRPDLVSARLAAAQQDTRVEVTTLRDEYSNTYVNHDGTLTTETSSTPLRLQRDGDWIDVDYALEHVDGGWSPKASPVPVVFSDGADADAVSIGAGTRQVDLSWDVTLPKPTIDGSKASYDLGGGETLVLTATSTGFEQSLVLAQAPTTLPQIKLPFDPSDLTLVPNAGGGYDFLNASGSAVYTMQAPVMYGSAIDPETEEPAQSKVVASMLVQTAAGPRLDLSPSLAWLQDPSTTYPVTIDPSVSAVSGGADTYVQDNDATAEGSSTVLHVGEYAGTNPARAYLKWTTGMASYTGKHIQSATLNLWNWNVGSCTAATINAYPLTSTFTTGSTVWTNKPTYTTSSTYAGSASFAHGIEGSCPNAAASIDVTKIVAAWAAGTMDPANGLQLSGTESSGSQYWGFCSMNYDPNSTGSCNVSGRVPMLSITYNSYPSTPTSRSVKPCSAQCSGTILTSSATPKLTGKANDPDGGSLRDDFEVWAGNSPSPTTEVTSGSVSNVTAGSTGSWTVPASTLTNGSTYEYRVRAWDGTDYGAWSGWTVFKIDTTPPATPALTSTAWTSNGWTTNTSGSITWSDSSTDVASYSYQLDGGGWSTPSTSTSASLSGLALGSWHTLTVQATDTAGNVSTDGTLAFGVGTGGLTSPVDDGRTQARVTLSAKGASGYGWVWYQWRQGTTSFWNNLSSTDVTVPGTNNPPAVWPVAPIGDSYVWNLANTVSTAGGGDGLVQVRACVATSSAGAGGVCQPTPVDVQLVKTAFGASYATEDVGPGSASLLTGDYSISENDVSEAGYQDQLSLDRSLTTLKPAAASATVTGVFGPAWTASLTGPDAGYGSYIPVVASDLSYINFTADDGSALLYTATNALTSSTITYQGVGDADDGSAVTLDSLRTTLVLTDLDGTKTTWVKQSGQWIIWQVEESGTAANTTSSWVYGTSGISAGLPVQIIAPTPYNLLNGNAACDVSNAATTPGCRSLTFDYTSIAVGGSNVTRLTGVNLVAYNPNKTGGAGMDSVAVAAYDYDSGGRLAHAWDPRITPLLKTAYTYDANNRLATLTPPGQATWTFGYDASNRLTTVSRPDPSGSTAVNTIVYDVALSGSGSPFDLTKTTTATWSQDDLPTVGAAVFGADYVPTAGTAAALTAEDWKHADLSYLDVNGRTVDAASYATGAWQYAATAYNGDGNVVWSLAPGNLAQALNPTADTDPAAAALASSADRADLLSSINVYSSDGLKLTDTLGPIHPVQLSDGTQVDARAHTHTDYDEGAPAGGPYLLPTTTVTSAQTTDGVDHDRVTSHTGYGAVVTGDTDGWTLRQATTSTQQLGSSPSANDLVTTTRYNDRGQVIQSRLPADAAGGHAGTTVTSYYAASGTGSCVSPALAGLVCSVGPAAQPSTGNPLPVTAYSYDMFGNVLTETETAGSTVRTTTTSYDPAERLASTSIAVTPAGAGGTALPTVNYGYDSATGLPTTISTTSGGVTTTLTTGYDNLGRATSYTDAGNVTSTTGYDLAGRPSTSYDGKATTSYSYDSYSGQLVSEDVGVGPSPTTFTATYNGDGSLASQTYPSGLVQAYRYDNTGDPTTLTYTMGSTQWLQFSQTSSAQGQTVAQSSPQSIQQFSYDGAGRLTSVADTALSMTNWTISCTTRTYGFDRNSNRTSLSSYPDDGSNPSGGGCSTTTTPTVVNSSFDDADRVTNSGYVYDTLGRTTTVPAADAVSISSVAFITGTMSVGYYANDYVASEAQGAYTAVFGLDPEQDREAKLTFGANVATYHYSDDSDSPSWFVDNTGAWTRYVSGIAGNLAATQSSNGSIELNLPNLHGDVVASVPDSTTATGIDGYSESTEYGQPRNVSQSYNTYGWLGAKQRSSNSLGGMILMGVRLYDPVTGRFLSVDPVPGGNTDAYTYPVDPINGFDLDGKCWGICWVKKAYHKVVHGAKKVGHFVRHHWKAFRRALEFVGGIAFVAAVCVGGMGIVCVVGAAAFYGATTSELNYRWDHGRHATRSGMRWAGVRGAITGGANRYAAWRASARTAYGWGSYMWRNFRSRM